MCAGLCCINLVRQNRIFLDSHFLNGFELHLFKHELMFFLEEISEGLDIIF